MPDFVLLYHRPDGSFVVRRGGLPYHVTQADPLYGAVSAAAETATLPPEPEPAPVARNPRLVTGTEFLALFTPAEVAAMWAADPRIMAGALKVTAQDSCNMDSAECGALLALAVEKGALAEDRIPTILAAQPPA